MHSKISTLLPGIVALTMLVSGAAADEEIENLVSNPDFELGTEGWTIGSIADGAGGELSIDKKEDAIVGNTLWAQIHGVGNDAWEPEIHSPAFDVEGGNVYTVSLWAKTEPEATRTIGVKFEQLDTWVGPSTTFTLTDEWQEFHFSPTMDFTSPPQSVIHIQFNFMKEDVWFSHFRVYEGEYVEEDIEGQQKISVTPAGRLAIAWGQIKSR
jgi:hypothetical protein